MISWIAVRWRIVVAAVVVVALVAALGTWAAIQLVGSARDDALDCSMLEAPTFEQAGALARGCGTDVEVLAERTPWQTSWELASGDSQVELSAMPERVEVNGEWTELDTTLVANEAMDEITVAAPVFPMALNAGGEAGRGQPLGSITHEGHTLDVWFPLELPVPELSETQAVYELGEGIRLFVNVNIDGSGFIPIVELVDADAAERFEEMLEDARAEHGGVSSGIDVEFATAYSEGLTMLEPDEEGLVLLVDESEETIFHFSSPAMWDSSGEELPIGETVTEVGLADRTRSPGGGDRIVMMDVAVVDDTVVITPDAEMLESTETVWPVYIDPTSSNGKTPHEWIAVRTGGYTNSLYKWGDISSSMPGQGMGNCTQVASCNVVFKQRLSWEFDGLQTFGNMAEADIKSATFRVNGVHSYNCTAQKANLIRTYSINTSRNWSSMGDWSILVGSRTDYHSSSCGNTGFKNYNATAGVKWLAANSASNLTLGLKANSESNMNGWKRFRHDAKLDITYNRAPTTPTNPGLGAPEPAACVTGNERPVIAEPRPKLGGVVNDPDTGDTLQPSFTVTTVGESPVTVWNSGNLAPADARGQRSERQLPFDLDEGVYRWQMRAWDTDRYSPYTAWCEFEVDTTPPVAPTVTPVTTGVTAVYEENRERGGVNQAGSFTLNRGVSDDVVTFLYGFNDDLTTQLEQAGGGTVVIPFPASESGPVTLYVKSRDKAGNTSAARQYTFVVAAPTEDAIWMMDEGVGTTAAGSAGNPVRDLTVLGNEWSWVDGPHELFDSREGDRALRFEGVDAYAETEGPVVDTTQAFVVSAHVRLDAAAISSSDMTVLAQDGDERSAFRLEYRASCPGMSGGCWAFAMPDTSGGSGETIVRSEVPVTGGEWVHLVGEFDAINQGEDEHSMRLWVCEIGTPSEPAIGDPKLEKETRTATPWYQAGAFTVGRALAGEQATGFWHGEIDNVRVFTGEVVDPAKIRRLCQGAEATDFGGNGDELDPTIEGGL